jgi:hypothetical protein
VFVLPGWFTAACCPCHFKGKMEEEFTGIDINVPESGQNDP